MFKKLLLILVFAVFGVTQTGYAQIMLEQGKIFIKASPGETVVDTITVHNLSKTAPANLRLYWEDFIYIEPFDGPKEFMAGGTSDRSCAKWVSFSPQQFPMDPLGTKKVTYSIQVPANAKGGFYGVLFFESAPAKSKEQVGLSIVSRIGSLFLIESTDHDKTARIENLKVKDHGFSGDFYNAGNVVMIPDATFYVMDSAGLVSDRGEIKKFYLAPLKKVSFDVKINEKIVAGDYTAVLTFDLGDGDNIVKEIEFQKSAQGALIIKQTHD